MLKLLHSADWHLDAPLTKLPPDLRARLHAAQRSIPSHVAALCRQERCQALLLSGDLFHVPPCRDTLEAVWEALGALTIPVLIAPGNHDFYQQGNCYAQSGWPDNVHIFTKPALEALELPDLDCRFYGAGYRSMDCPGLLADFHAEGSRRYAVALCHADPTQLSSPYSPMTAAQVRESGLDYLALGHIHKHGAFRAGSTLCAWPGCPMGQGFDETGAKGVLLVTLDAQAEAKFLPLALPQFHDLEVAVEHNPMDALLSQLPAGGSNDCFRVTLTGTAEPGKIAALRLPAFPNLLLRDRTTAPGSLWESMEQDSLEGAYFRLLHEAENPALGRLAAEISRQILQGREVRLP